MVEPAKTNPADAGRFRSLAQRLEVDRQIIARLALLGPQRRLREAAVAKDLRLVGRRFDFHRQAQVGDVNQVFSLLLSSPRNVPDIVWRTPRGLVRAAGSQRSAALGTGACQSETRAAQSSISKIACQDRSTTSQSLSHQEDARQPTAGSFSSTATAAAPCTATLTALSYILQEARRRGAHGCARRTMFSRLMFRSPCSTLPTVRSVQGTSVSKRFLRHPQFQNASRSRWPNRTCGELCISV